MYKVCAFPENHTVHDLEMSEALDLAVDLSADYLVVYVLDEDDECIYQCERVVELPS